jgi:hypothetical protein
MGPFETIDLNAPDGLRDYCQRYGGMYESIAKEQTDTGRWDTALISAVEQQRRDILPQSRLRDRRLWRDQQLMALLRHKIDRVSKI